jgi:hypothetical protein
LEDEDWNDQENDRNIILDLGLIADGYNGITRADFEAAISTNNVSSHHLYQKGILLRISRLSPSAIAGLVH